MGQHGLGLAVPRVRAASLGLPQAEQASCNSSCSPLQFWQQHTGLRRREGHGDAAADVPRRPRGYPHDLRCGAAVGLADDVDAARSSTCAPTPADGGGRPPGALRARRAHGRTWTEAMRQTSTAGRWREIRSEAARLEKELLGKVQGCGACSSQDSGSAPAACMGPPRAADGVRPQPAAHEDPGRPPRPGPHELRARARGEGGLHVCRPLQRHERCPG
mmetsp:Transcript_27391/g.56902  ORF Transcript_27391/g.56902 Transcript_27391/m.56902 type:complete len:218 (+) Transcript_27391:188-841(+)